jgi:hypothetical protein
MKIILILIGSITVIIWGMAHIIPTKSVVKKYGDISSDNKKILIMEWINEGLSLIFIGILVVLITIFSDPVNISNKIVDISSACLLFSMAVLSFFTGFKVKFLPYKLCPFIFSLSGILILIGCFLKL